MRNYIYLHICLAFLGFLRLADIWQKCSNKSKKERICIADCKPVCWNLSQQRKHWVLKHYILAYMLFFQMNHAHWSHSWLQTCRPQSYGWLVCPTCDSWYWILSPGYIKGRLTKGTSQTFPTKEILEHPKQSPKSKHHVPALIASSGIAFLTLEFQSVVSRKPQTGHSSKSTCLPWPLTALKTCPTHQHWTFASWKWIWTGSLFHPVLEVPILDRGIICPPYVLNFTQFGQKKSSLKHVKLSKTLDLNSIFHTCLLSLVRCIFHIFPCKFPWLNLPSVFQKISICLALLLKDFLTNAQMPLQGRLP